MEHKEQLLSLFSVTNKGYELVPNKDDEIKQEGEKFYLVKTKKEYPKTYEECYKITNLSKTSDIYSYKNGLLFDFQKLLIARDAYWKIAGEEIGLGKPWEADWKNGNQTKYCIYNDSDDIKKDSLFFTNTILSFPTEEMRDAFYENFKVLIEECKELL